MDSSKRGNNVRASEATETRPSLLPVGTCQLKPLVCRTYIFNIIFFVSKNSYKLKFLFNVARCPVKYQNNSITCGKCEDISAGNDTRAGGLELCFSGIDDVITSYSAIGRGALLGVRAVDEDGAIAALDEAVVEVHSENAGSYGGIRSEMRRNCGPNNVFGSRART